MPSERPARREIREQGVQVGVVGEHRGELVDDDHEPRHPRDCVDVASAGVSERTLTEPQLGAQALERAQRPVLVEVGHDTNGVRQRLECRERRSALEVDEQERDAIGWMPRRHREHPRDEQLALAAARRAAHDGVRAVLDQVDVHRAGAAHREGRTQSAVTGRRRLEQRAERNHRRQGRRRADEALTRGLIRERGRPLRCLPPRHRLGAEGASLAGIGMPGDRRQRAARDLDDDPAGGGQAAGGAVRRRR